MTRNTITVTVSTMPSDTSFLSWATRINASGLFREALAEQMVYRDIDCNEPSRESLTGTSRDLDDLLKPLLSRF
jgi:hypothetical protein